MRILAVWDMRMQLCDHRRKPSGSRLRDEGIDWPTQLVALLN
jgi:hypothetical protein